MLRESKRWPGFFLHTKLENIWSGGTRTGNFNAEAVLPVAHGNARALNGTAWCSISSISVLMCWSATHYETRHRRATCYTSLLIERINWAGHSFINPWCVGRYNHRCLWYSVTPPKSDGQPIALKRLEALNHWRFRRWLLLRCEHDMGNRRGLVNYLGDDKWPDAGNWLYLL